MWGNASWGGEKGMPWVQMTIFKQGPDLSRHSLSQAQSRGTNSLEPSNWVTALTKGTQKFLSPVACHPSSQLLSVLALRSSLLSCHHLMVEVNLSSLLSHRKCKFLGTGCAPSLNCLPSAFCPEVFWWCNFLCFLTNFDYKNSQKQNIYPC